MPLSNFPAAQAASDMQVSGAWQSFWAVANWRPFDLVAAAIIFGFVLAWLRADAGAHWMTDILVGGLAMALILLSVGYATPLATRLACAIDRYADLPVQFGIRIGRSLRILR